MHMYVYFEFEWCADVATIGFSIHKCSHRFSFAYYLLEFNSIQFICFASGGRETKSRCWRVKETEKISTRILFGIQITNSRKHTHTNRTSFNSDKSLEPRKIFGLFFFPFFVLLFCMCTFEWLNDWININRISTNKYMPILFNRKDVSSLMCAWDDRVRTKLLQSKSRMKQIEKKQYVHCFFFIIGDDETIAPMNIK